MDSQAEYSKVIEKRDAPEASEDAAVSGSQASSNLVSGGGVQVLVPGKKRLMREAYDSDSDEEAVQAPRPPPSKKTHRSVIWAMSSSSSMAGAKIGRFRKKLDEGESDESENEVQYVRTECAELSQSLLTSWLVPRRSRTGRRV